jgi:hypothetical protein
MGTRPPHHSAARTDLVLLIRRTMVGGEYSGIFERPAGGPPPVMDVRDIKAVACPHGFSVPCEEIEAGG